MHHFFFFILRYSADEDEYRRWTEQMLLEHYMRQFEQDRMNSLPGRRGGSGVSAKRPHWAAEKRSSWLYDDLDLDPARPQRHGKTKEDSEASWRYSLQLPLEAFDSRGVWSVVF